MKTIIYPLILLVVLCSCKGNAFMKQRYTTFAHASNKNTTKEKKIIISETNKDREPEILQKSELTNVSASAANDIKIENIILPVYNSIQFRAETNIVQTKNVEDSDHVNPIVKEKKVTHQKSQIAKRLLGTLFKIVLWIIILAVVVGIIIIIGALA